MKVVKWILIVIVILIAAVLGIALFLPSEVNVSASATISQPAPKLFHSLAKFTNRESWDPWISKDTTTKVTIAAKDDYTGSYYIWDGVKTGKGKMEIAEVEYPGKIKSYLMFDQRPDTSIVHWALQEKGGKTDVTWDFSAQAAYPMGRIFLNLMKNQLQEDFEQGLLNLENVVKGKEIPLSSLSDIIETEIPEKTAMVCKASGTMDELIAQMEKMFSLTMETAKKQELEITGPPFSYYTDYDAEKQTTTMYCGIPVATPGKPEGEVMSMVFPSTRAIMAVHTGPYEDFEKSYTLMMEYVEKNQIPVNWNAVEVYLNDPMQVKFPTLYKTEIYFELDE